MPILATPRPPCFETVHYRNVHVYRYIEPSQLHICLQINFLPALWINGTVWCDKHYHYMYTCNAYFNSNGWNFEVGPKTYKSLKALYDISRMCSNSSFPQFPWKKHITSHMILVGYLQSSILYGIFGSKLFFGGQDCTLVDRASDSLINPT